MRAEYGERLICVRYRYDTQQQKRYKTVELVVAEEQWTPPMQPTAPEQIVAIRVSAPDEDGSSAGQTGGWAVGPTTRRVGVTL